MLNGMVFSKELVAGYQDESQNQVLEEIPEKNYSWFTVHYTNLLEGLECSSRFTVEW